MEEQIKKIIDMLRELLLRKPEFYGKVKLNFHKGIIANVNVEESINLDEKS